VGIGKHVQHGKEAQREQEAPQATPEKRISLALLMAEVRTGYLHKIPAVDDAVP
jgi:hypothetical protein